MTPINMQFGETRVERIALSLTRADKDRILQNFPEKIAVSVPNFGTQEYPLRSFVKSFLDQVQLPSVKVTFEVRGQEGDAALSEVSASGLQVFGTSGGSFMIADTHVSYEFDAEIRGNNIAMEFCTCPEGEGGQQASRKFTISWLIEIALEPGVSGLYEVADIDLMVMAPCCCLSIDETVEDDDDEDDEDDVRERKKSKKKKEKDK